MSIEAPFYPIIYVRGYAATMGEIEETVATPYMGFNLGATKLRQDYKGEIVRLIFESPLIRLMKDEGYQDAYENGDYIPKSQRVTAKSVWIFRYYEPVSEDLGEGERRLIPRFAADLRDFILRVRKQVCGDDAEALDRFKVYLVAHSMGGLICRCYLQNLCRRGAVDAFEDAAEVAKANKDLKLEHRPAPTFVDKVFTYATPHKGIDMAGLNVPDLGNLDRLHVRNFNRNYMRKYLALSDGNDRVDSLDGAFPEERFFCFVGTNYRDYSAFFGLSKKGTGPMSDGLVMIKNASVHGAPRAFAHRSHSGHYGIVNSEEGYQNLRRFLFGNLRVDANLLVDEITLPKVIEDQADGNRKNVKAAYDIEASATLRGLNVMVNERKVAQESAIRRTYEELVHEKKPIYLFSGYLLNRAKTERSRDTALAFQLSLAIQVPIYEIDKRLWFDDHFEGGHVFKNDIIFYLEPSTDRATLRYEVTPLSSESPPARLLEPLAIGDGRLCFELPLGFEKDAVTKPKPGFRGRLQLIVSPWNAA